MYTEHAFLYRDFFILFQYWANLFQSRRYDHTMPSITKRKRVAAASQQPMSSLAQQRNISVFGKISKSPFSTSGKDSRKRKLDDGCDNERSDLATANKRKCMPGVVWEDGNRTKTQLELKATAVNNNVNPNAPPKKARTQPISVETLTKGARSRLEFLCSKSSKAVTALPEPKQLETPPSSQDQTESNELPEPLQDLVDLHSSFLTALSLHYAHNGSDAPADIRAISPAIAKTWRRRKVSEDDIRRILSFHREKRIGGSTKTTQASLFNLIDYGHGKICIELSDSQAQQTHRQPVNEETLNTRFYRILLQKWDNFKTTDASPPPSPTTFITTLPLHQITPTNHSKNVSKGQTRLADLKAIIQQRSHSRVLNPTTDHTASPSPSQPIKPKDPFARSTDLKSRIFARSQLHHNNNQQSALSITPATPETIARRSLLQRLPEIAPVLESLALGAQKHCNDDAATSTEASTIPTSTSSSTVEDALWDKSQMRRRGAAMAATVSFTLPTLVQNLQTSLRNPISKDEAGRCVRLLGDVVPEWVGIREIGRVVGVTVRGAGVGKGELARRVEIEVAKV